MNLKIENAAPFEAAFSLSIGFHDQHDEDGEEAHYQVQGQLKSRCQDREQESDDMKEESHHSHSDHLLIGHAHTRIG